jgi:DNA-binding transcriptional LysR family regulator
LASRSFTVDELNAYPALLTEAHGNMRWWDTPQIKVTGYLPAKIFSLSGFLAVPLLLRDSPLVCITAYRLSKIFTEGNPVTEIPMPFSDHIITIRQYWHERWHNDPAHRWLRQLIYSICQDL